VAKIALIQNLFPTLNQSDPKQITGFSRQLYDKFYQVLVDESGHELQCAATLEAYQEKGFPTPDMVICSPFGDEGNLAPGFAELGRIIKTFSGIPIIVWSSRTEEVIRVSVLEDQGAAAYYTGTALDAPDDFADMVLEFIKK
jgi:hypothetical protein